MNFILVDGNKVVENTFVEYIEIYNNEKTSLYYDNSEDGEGHRIGINVDLFVVDECKFEVGKKLTNEQLEQLNEIDRKIEFTKK